MYGIQSFGVEQFEIQFNRNDCEDIFDGAIIIGIFSNETNLVEIFGHVEYNTWDRKIFFEDFLNKKRNNPSN